MRPDDLPLLRECLRPALTPDGTTAIVPVTRPDLDADAATGGLWAVPVDGSAPPRPLTRPALGGRDTAPAVSPDGRWIAFLRAAPKGRPQIHLVEVGGGEPLALTDQPLGAGEPRWSPDGRRLAWVARVPEEGRYGTDEEVGADAEPPRLLTRLAHRIDGLGYTRDRQPHVFVLDLPDLDPAPSHPLPELPEPRQLTDGDHADADVAWHPDGSRLAFTSDRHPTSTGPHGEDLRRGIWVVDADGGQPAPLVTGQLACADPHWLPDGSALVLLAQEMGEDGIDFVARNTGLFTVPDGGGDPVRLTGAEEVDLGDVGAHLTVTAAGVLATERRRGTARLLRIDPADGTTEVLVDGPVRARGHAATADGRTVVAVLADGARPGDLHRIDVAAAPGGGAGRATTRLTDVAADLRDGGRIRPLIEVEVPSADGYPVHGWAVLPDADRWGGGPHPVLLHIHGGPYADYGVAVFDEAQVAAGAGYAVLMCNPRGSAGYGEAHGRAIRGRVGSVDADDVLAFLDGALAQEDLRLDGGRVGVMGGSYGGYMTALLTTRTDRFAGAVVERGYLDPVSFVGSADIGWFFPGGYHGEDESAMRAQSPMAHVASATTPTLVIHSEQDWRTPIEQGLRWWVALKRQGVEAELLVFPGEGHELTRSGRPRHRRARFEHILRWWDRHLPVGPRAVPAEEG